MANALPICVKDFYGKRTQIFLVHALENNLMLVLHRIAYTPHF
jgi:hypothetical protein